MSVPKLHDEPVAFASVVAVVLNLFLAFGLKLDVEQVAAINAVAVLVGGLLVRSKVSPV